MSKAKKRAKGLQDEGEFLRERLKDPGYTTPLLLKVTREYNEEYTLNLPPEDVRRLADQEWALAKSKKASPLPRASEASMSFATAVPA